MATQEERDEVLRLFADVRVTDVCDGMDSVGLQDVGLMDTQIRPLWRDTDAFAHRIYGIAHTLRFVPTNRRAPLFQSPEEFKKALGKLAGFDWGNKSSLFAGFSGKKGVKIATALLNSVLFGSVKVEGCTPT